MEPRVRVSALLRWDDRVLLCRQEKPGKVYWLLPGGGVDSGESLLVALHRELKEELGIEWHDLPLEGPIALVDSIAPPRTLARKHVIHVIWGAAVSARSREEGETRAAATHAARLFSPPELEEIVLPPPIKRFLGRWRPGDP